MAGRNRSAEGSAATVVAADAGDGRPTEVQPEVAVNRAMQPVQF